MARTPVAYPYLYQDAAGVTHLLRCRSAGEIDHTEALARRSILFSPTWLRKPALDKARQKYLASQRLVIRETDWRVESENLTTHEITSHSIGPVEQDPICIEGAVFRVIQTSTGRDIVDGAGASAIRPPRARSIGFSSSEFQAWLVRETVVEWHLGAPPCEVRFTAGVAIVRLIPVHGRPGSWIASTATASFYWSGRELREILVAGKSVSRCSLLGETVACESGEDILLAPLELSGPLSVETAPHGRPMWALARNYAEALARWSVSGWPTVTSKVYEQRLAICRACPYWREQTSFRLARCNACRCTTLKHVMATESCPKGFWKSDLLGRSLDGIFPWHRGGHILCSTDVMLLDVDRLEETAALENLKSYLVRHPDAGFRVYRTAKGLRYILTSHLHPISQGAELQRIAGELGVDRQYLSYAMQYGCYAARLTPKRERLPKDAMLEDRSVCELVGQIGSSTIQDRIAKLIALHDEHTLGGKPLA